MYYLVVTACLLTAPERCQTVTLDAVLSAFTPMQCFTAAKSEITKWADAHPKWAVKKWKCKGESRTP